MTAILVFPVPETHCKSVQSEPEITRNQASGIWLLDLYRNAIARARITQEQLAKHLQQHPSTLTKKLDTNGTYKKDTGLRLEDVGLSPRAVLREFVVLLAEELGMSVTSPDRKRVALSRAIESLQELERAWSDEERIA